MPNSTTDGRILYTERVPNGNTFVIVDVGGEPRQFIPGDETLYRDATIYLGKDVEITHDSEELPPQTILGIKGKGNDA